MNEMTQLLVAYAEPALFLAIFAEQIGVPFPGAAVLVAAGTLAADGSLNPTLAICVTIAASLLADLIWFHVGRTSGKRVFRFLTRFSLCDASRFEQTERFFARYGMSAIVFGKFVPGLSLVVPPLAGAFKTNISKFLWFDSLGSLLYGFLYLGLGYVFKDEVNGALACISHIGLGAVGLAAAAIVIFFAWKHLHHRKTAKSSSAVAAGAFAVTSGT